MTFRFAKQDNRRQRPQHNQHKTGNNCVCVERFITKIRWAQRPPAPPPPPPSAGRVSNANRMTEKTAHGKTISQINTTQIEWQQQQCQRRINRPRKLADWKTWQKSRLACVLGLQEDSKLLLGKWVLSSTDCRLNFGRCRIRLSADLL